MAGSNNMYSNSPVVAMPPPAPDQYFTENHYGAAANRQSPNVFGAPVTPSASIPPTPNSIAGRKRSRGDDLAPEEEEIQPDGSLPTPVEEAPFSFRGQPLTGPGMTLIYPDDPGYGIAAESQSGTWIEDRNERKPFQLQHTKRPSTSSRKSQRLGTSASGSDDLAQLVLPPTMREATREPLIDEATRVLGISWARMDSSEALLINQAAYNKFVQNHYPSLRDVSIWFENSALPGYLVVASNAYSGLKEYYLFSHDLAEARLVTRDPNDLLPRLKMLPALHLAAPGGHIRAETDWTSAAHNELNNVLPDSAIRDGTYESMVWDDAKAGRSSADYAGPEAVPLCAAHEMELD